MPVPFLPPIWGVRPLWWTRAPHWAGVCLNDGCIPSKVLLHAAEVTRETQEMTDDWGIAFSKPQIDLDKLRAKKDGVIATLTDGLTGLAKRRKVQAIKGMATFKDPETINIDGVDWTFDQIVIAVGSAPV